MSAQLSQQATTRLLIAEKSENSAYELDSALRDAGIATKLSISDDLAHIAHMVGQGETDIAVLTDKIDGLETLIPQIRENAPHTPVILLTDDSQESPWSVANALNLGATDAVPASCPDQLALVIKRELENVCQRQNFSQIRRALKEAEERCQLLLQGAKSAIAYVHEGMHIHANEHYLDLFGYTDIDELCGESLADILCADSVQALKQQLKALRPSSNNPADGEDTERRVATSSFEFVSAPRNDNQQAISGTMSLTNSLYEGEECLQVTVKVSDEGKPEEKPATSPTAKTEELELPGFVKAADSFFANETNSCFVMVAGIDNFNNLQQAYGLVGTETICRKVWQKFVELTTDFPVIRLSHHQFALAMVADSREQIFEISDNIRRTVADYIFEVQDKTVRPSVTLAGIPYDNETGVSQCLDAAHVLLLDSFESEASNTVVLPQEAAQDDGIDGAKVILRQITDAIENKTFITLFQPIISLRGDSDEHYEVFLRMAGEEGEQIEPAQFLQTAIDNNVAGKIDRWVILQSIKMLSVHRAKGHATRLTINLTSNSVTDPEFLQWLGVAIKAARLPSDAVIFQITEKDATTYLRQTREFVEGLRNMHCRASLSRFGLIEDPFETLRHIPVDMVKLDGACVADNSEDEEGKDKLVSTIQQLQNAGKLTIVPMVENANILSTLWQAGANYIQGHYLQEPSTEMDYDFSTED